MTVSAKACCENGGRDEGWAIYCDFDGTIALVDVVDSLLERFAPPEWRDIEREWRSGSIGSRECLSRQVSLIEMSPEELKEHLKQIEIDPDFPQFVTDARSIGCSVLVLSDGLDYPISCILERYNLASVPIAANKLSQSNDKGRWGVSFPHFQKKCRVVAGNCKCAASMEDHLVGRRSLLIGDGASDFCMAQTVDYVFAKGELVKHCQRRGLSHEPIKGFLEARNLLSSM